MIYAAVDIGGTKIAYGLFDSDKKTIDTYKVSTNNKLTAEKFFSQIADTIMNLLNQNGLSVSDLSGIGICMPGMISSDGFVSLIAMIPTLQGFHAGKYLRERFNKVRVEIANDSHAAALAEYHHGAGKGNKHMIYCPVSTGFASAIIINGKLFTGSNGAAGESGHTVLTPNDGILCGCGNKGCVCSYASGSMITRHIAQWIKEGENSIMVSLAGNVENITAQHIKKAYEKGDGLAGKALDQMAQYMGLWLFNLYITLNIDCFVFGGGLINMGEMLFGRIEKVFKSYCFTNFPVYFKFAELGQDSGLIGALELLF